MSQITPASIRKNASIATIAILGSRILGLVREQIFAFCFGASFALDAFIAAFRIPNLLRDLFAEGALSQSFTTVFSQKVATGRDDVAYALANKVATFLTLLLGVLVLLGMIFSPQIVGLIANGFSGEKLALTVLLNRILFPFILFVGLAALMMGMLNAKNKFFLPQSASTFFNITSIVAGLLLAHFLAPDYTAPLYLKIFDPALPTNQDPDAIARAITGMAFGTLLGGIVQWAIQLPGLRRLGYRPGWNTDFKDPDFVRILKLTFPAIIGGASVQINVMINTLFASYLVDGSLSYLNYAFRLMQFPLGLFGVAIAAASAPVLARMVTQKQTQGFTTTLRQSLQMSLFLSLPSAAGLIVLASPIVGLIYEHGRFNADDTVQTSLALMAYSLGIAGYSLIKIYQPAFLAHHDSRTPMQVSLLSIALNALLNWIFIMKLNLGQAGLALSTSIVATLNLVFLAVLFRKWLRDIWNQQLIIYFFKCAGASVLMASLVWYLLPTLQSFFPDKNLLAQVLLVALPIFIAVPLYWLLCVALRVPEAASLLNRLRRLR